MDITALSQPFTVCKLPSADGADLSVPFTFLSVTDEEVSLVCPTAHAPAHAAPAEHGWRAFKIEGTLDFGMVGVLAGICGALAARGISIFAVSTYNTDYILVKQERYSDALFTLSESGHSILQASTGRPMLIGTTSPLGSQHAQGYTYVCALSRFEGGLLLSRRADRQTWETQGGHIEPGETPLAAMRRELYEECGALDYTLRPLCDYSAAGTHGMFFFTDIAALGPLPPSEMAGVRRFDALPPPDMLTYPGITPVLWERAKKELYGL